ncbi:hypothetical protein Anas_07675, partial [Armadillidium nasatum]
MRGRDSPIESTFKRDFNLKSPAVTTITRASADFCQVRIDFTTFHIGEANSNGTCSEGWTASGHNNTNNVPNVICGLNDGQHVYLNFANDNPITLITVFDDSTGVDSWNFKFTQIACDDTDNLGTVDAAEFDDACVDTSPSYDYVQIENGNFKGSDGSTTSASKFCGVGFPSTVT